MVDGSYDQPGALNRPLQQWLGSGYEEYQTQINLLYSLYALPNMVMPFVGGVLMDYSTPNLLIVVFGLIVLTGQTLFSYGVQVKSMWMMGLGRLLFGFGAESLDVGQADIITKYFQGSGLSFVLGLNLSIARMATGLNDNLSPYLARVYSVPQSVWFGLVVCSISFVAGLLLIQVTRSTKKPEIVIEKSPDDTQETVDERFHWTQIFEFPMQFWILFGIVISLYGSIVPFFHVCTDFFQSKFQMNEEEAALLMSIPDWISAVGSPLGGLYLDTFGHRKAILLLSCLMLLLSHSLLALTSFTPYIPMTIIGVSYSLFASALWPSVPQIVKENEIATAYGLLTSALNLSLFAFPLIVAWIRQSQSFLVVQLFFIGLSVVSILLTLLLNFKQQDSPLSTNSSIVEPPSRPRHIGDGLQIAGPWTLSRSLPDRRSSTDSTTQFARSL
ncbi:major facilitator superfamily domain-containing protein [Gorgonomyces haynaldii]|nr:major facilitator superfamily domain-containing protein [Gorgonomyces haynaldii]